MDFVSYNKAAEALKAVKSLQDGQVTANTRDISILKGDINTEGSILKSIKDNAKDGIYSNANSGLSATTINNAIDELDNDISELESKINTINGDASTTGSIDNKIKTQVLDNIIDEDDMASNANNKIPTQQSVKAYVDAIASAQNEAINNKADISIVPVHIEQADEPDINTVKPGDTWWDTNDNKLYKCVTLNGNKTWLQIA